MTALSYTPLMQARAASGPGSNLKWKASWSSSPAQRRGFFSSRLLTLLLTRRH